MKFQFIVKDFLTKKTPGYDSLTGEESLESVEHSQTPYRIFIAFQLKQRKPYVGHNSENMWNSERFRSHQIQ